MTQTWAYVSTLRDRLKNTLKPMKWNICHFSLDPLPPLRNEIPSYVWLHSMMVNTSPVRCKPIFFGKSEIVTMKSPTPPPPQWKIFHFIGFKVFLRRSLSCLLSRDYCSIIRSSSESNTSAQCTESQTDMLGRLYFPHVSGVSGPKGIRPFNV